MSNEQLAILFIGGGVGLFLAELAIGFIWLHYTTAPKPKRNKLDKKGKTNGR